MGFGHYSFEAHEALLQSRAGASPGEIFARNDCDPKMSPRGVTRESRDSKEHPASTGIVFALDVSGSMGDIPRRLATKTLPTFMQSVASVLPDPQILFMAFGNAYSDNSPLQVGQFESEAHLIDRWLSATHLEGGGGGLGESYDLAMYFAARHTAMDCLQKRKKKGYFFMTGDEVPFATLSRGHVASLIGDSVERDIPIDEMTAELLTSFHAFFLIPDKERAATESCGAVWQMLLHERCVVLGTGDDAALASAMLIGIQEGKLKDREAVAKKLQDELGCAPEERDRVADAVAPFAAAIAKGEIAPPVRPGTRHDQPPTRG